MSSSAVVVREKKNFTPMEIFMHLSSGNPGAVTVLMKLVKVTILKTPSVPPEAMILSLVNNGFIGENIWILYKDVCLGNINHMIGVLRGIQMGYIEKQIVLNAINCVANIDVPSLYKQVQSEFPDLVP